MLIPVIYLILFAGDHCFVG